MVQARAVAMPAVGFGVNSARYSVVGLGYSTFGVGLGNVDGRKVDEGAHEGPKPRTDEGEEGKDLPERGGVAYQDVSRAHDGTTASDAALVGELECVGQDEIAHLVEKRETRR